MLKFLSLTAVAMMTTVSLAHAAPPVKPAPVPPPALADKAPPPPHAHPPGPCKPVMDSCKQAGFTRGGHTTHKNILADCVKPLENGQTVAGVLGLDKAQIDACKADHMARKAKFDARVKTDPAFAKRVADHKAAWVAKHPGVTPPDIMRPGPGPKHPPKPTKSLDAPPADR